MIFKSNFQMFWNKKSKSKWKIKILVTIFFDPFTLIHHRTLLFCKINPGDLTIRQNSEVNRNFKQNKNLVNVKGDRLHPSIYLLQPKGKSIVEIFLYFPCSLQMHWNKLLVIFCCTFWSEAAVRGFAHLKLNVFLF